MSEPTPKRLKISKFNLWQSYRSIFGYSTFNGQMGLSSDESFRIYPVSVPAYLKPPEFSVIPHGAKWNEECLSPENIAH